LKKLAGDQQLSVDAEIAPLERKLNDLRAEVYKNLSPLQRVQVARNPKRPFTLGLHQDVLHGLRGAARRPTVP
jgi:acetyl-CoA carboxylase carboxyl transferase subunit alpha